MENENTSDTIDLSDGMTSAGVTVAAAQADFVAKRRILDADELERAKDLKPRFELNTPLPGDSRGRSFVWFFSIDCTLDGTRLNGCLFANECILVQAKGKGEALRLAREGLHSTVELLREEMEQRHNVIETPINAGLMVDGGGTRIQAGDDVRMRAAPLASDPKMNAMLAHKIGGLPWKY